MKGKVWKDTHRNTWHYAVVQGDRVLAADNTRNWHKIFNECHLKVGAFREVTALGHRIEKTYDQLVDEATI